MDFFFWVFRRYCGNEVNWGGRMGDGEWERRGVLV